MVRVTNMGNLQSCTDRMHLQRRGLKERTKGLLLGELHFWPLVKVKGIS